MLEILGIIFLIVIGKFIYDTYFSNNTEKRWEEYKKENPERAYEVERNTGLNVGMSAGAKQAASFNKLSELQQVLTRLSMDLYKKVESREDYFEFSPQNKRNLEQYFKSVCSILSAAVIEAALDLDNVGANDPIRMQLKVNLRQRYLVFTNHLVKTNQVTFPPYHLSTTNDNAVGLHAAVKMGQHAHGIKHYLSTGRLSYLETTEDYDDDGDLFEYKAEKQYGFIQDIYEVGFDEVGDSIKVNFNELQYDIEDCKSDIASLLYFIRTFMTNLRTS
ncbi:hypothetical protein Dfri01_55760 [Dyadobacter frigoris]|uniref:hypothetical protein n=1 Tax=Dyadobacter frigoris TaxID=2576211 RepID=UPI0024A07135|nr:hypothetical protein [Dyadobacter frigoris]GLU56115.1 hypothetical protein Dfri01_55760 [Dyadobacter frigoris]